MRRMGLLLGFVLLSSVLSACSPPEPSGGGPQALDSTAGALALESAAADADRRGDRDLPWKYRAFALAFDAERQTLGAPGAAVAIIEHGRLTFARGFGTSGPNSATPVRATTLFRIGSMTKALTATALLSLVDDHALPLDARLKDVVPDVALAEPELSSLTVRQLLSQQSGLVDNNEMDGLRDDAALASVSTADAFRAAEYFMNPPGLFYNYSNPNYALAGLVTERLGGDWYRKVMAERVFEPLGMARTFFLASEVLADGDYALGKSADPSGGALEIAPDSYENAWMRPAGFAFSSVLDYARFVRWLHSGEPRVLSPRLRAAMQRIQVPTLLFGEEQGYGFGVMVNEGCALGSSYYSTAMVAHNGGIPGYASDFALLPATGFGVVVLANADGAYFSSSLALALRSFGGLPEPTSPPARWAVDPSTFPSLAGTYVDPHLLGPVTVSASGDAVQVSMPGLDAAGIAYDPVLTPVTADNFTVNLAAYGPQLVTFIKDASGSYTWLRTRLAVASREPTPSSALRAPAADAATLRERLRSASKRPEPLALRLRNR